MKKTILAVLISAISVLPSLSGAEEFSRVASSERMVSQDCQPTSGGGAIIGGGGGAWLGRALIGGPIGLIGGAIAGAYSGNEVEKNTKCVSTVYYLITLKNGQTFESERPYRRGQKIALD